MRFVALVSGGKDSTFAVSEAMKQGHELAAIAHLASFNLSSQLVTSTGDQSRFSVPGASVEQDSWMYQSVGSELVPLLAVAYDKPLYWIDPASGEDFSEDEDAHLKSFGASAFLDSNGRVDRDVVRLWKLLRFVKAKTASSPIQALVSGAILSNYQRTRIEVVCRALGWISISPLWQRDQATILSSMGTTAGIDARLIKAASIGIDSSHMLHALCPIPGTSSATTSNSDSEVPEQTSSPLGAELKKLSKKYGVNEAGEGGEYESFTLDANIFPFCRILPLEWSVVTPDDDHQGAQDASFSPVSHVRFHKVALVEKQEGALAAVSDSYGAAASALKDYVIPHSTGSALSFPDLPKSRTQAEVSEVETLAHSSGTITALLKALLETDRLIIITELTQVRVPIPQLGIDTPSPIARNPLAADPVIDALKVTGPHFTTAGGLVGTKLGINTSRPAGWKASNFYIEASHHVFEDCRIAPSAIDGNSAVAKDISQATQAVMNAIGKKLAENGISFRNVFFASLTIPSMSFFADMNPVYSSYFVPIQNPPSRVTVAQQPRHLPPSVEAAGPAPATVIPSIRVELWGLMPEFLDESLLKSLALSPKVFDAHNVLHVESYSGWAPACIGPYSQAHEVLGVDHLAGQIALVPTEMALFAPSTDNSDKNYLYDRTIGELRWALKHVASLVNARRTKSGVAFHSPQELLFSAMFTAVPLSIAHTCIQFIEENGTTEEKETARLVLNGATLLRVDQLPRLAAVEIQVMMDSPESALYDPVDSNLVPAFAKSKDYQEARKRNIFKQETDPETGYEVYTRYNVSQSLSYAHVQQIIVSGDSKSQVSAEKVVATAHRSLTALAPSIACQAPTSPSSAASATPSSLLSANLFYQCGETDDPAYFELSRSVFPFTPYAVKEVGATLGWVPSDKHILAAVNSKWALVLDLDD